MSPQGENRQPHPEEQADRKLPEIVTVLCSTAHRMHAERGRAREFRTALHRSRVPMFTVGSDRWLLDANLAARLLLHLSLEESRRRRVDELIAPHDALKLPALWDRMLERGDLFGIHELSSNVGTRMRVLVIAMANALPGEHLVVLAPAQWPGHELLDPEPPAPRPVKDLLSGREREVLQQVAAGSSLREIAELLAISEATVRTHLGNANRKLGARHRAHAVALALSLRLIASGDS